MDGEMDSGSEKFSAKSKIEVQEQEHAKLVDLFKDFDTGIKSLVSGLIDDAAFLYAENWALAKMLAVTGMIKVHPDRPDLQKVYPAAAQYRANEKAYANIISKLAAIIQRNQGGDEDDDFDDFQKQHS